MGGSSRKDTPMMAMPLLPFAWLPPSVNMCLQAAILSLCVMVAHQAPLTQENSAWNVNKRTAYEPSTYYGEWDGHQYFPSPPDWRTIPIYQLITDRFADGDPMNNQLYEGEYDLRDMTLRHGGDFLGLKKHLPYIKGLGCKGIWISPVFQNGFNNYHQYAMNDFTLIDKRMGTLEEFRELVQAAHDLGIYVIVDIVMNHMANELYFDPFIASQAPFVLHEDEYNLKPRFPDELLSTPAGLQPYADFWYNNTFDPQGSYGTMHGHQGFAETDIGGGTHTWSDFHHNGDLINFLNVWGINLGKIYGIMDDLRLEHKRVQDKYIAMTKALISSTDIDGFRCDTPMQVPLDFFKAWAPAMREHAHSLGKDNFLIFGEFYVSTERYATMTGRGKTPENYGKDQYIEGEATLKGGIVYLTYFYLFTALVHQKTDYMEELGLAYEQENLRIDTFDPQTNRSEYLMYNFCNNHDNWRMQMIASEEAFRLCLIVVQFWPGVPLHYAGDEQMFTAPGSALDGWAREELAPSLAWSSLRTNEVESGNVADRDNFDMTKPFYLFVRRLNELRSAYFGEFQSEECDVLNNMQVGFPDVLAYYRGCTADGQVLVLANADPTESRSFTVRTPWTDGTDLFDVIPEVSTGVWATVVGNNITAELGPLEAVVLVPGPVKILPPAVVTVSPRHAEVIPTDTGSFEVTIRFDRPMRQDVALAASFNGTGEFMCLNSSCQELVLEVTDPLQEGFYEIEVAASMSQDGLMMISSFRSMFQVANISVNILAAPGLHDQPNLICNTYASLCHKATGATWMRTRMGGESWSSWIPYQAEQDFASQPGVPVLAQYYAEGSAAYVVGDCVFPSGERCKIGWHDSIYLRGDMNSWGEGSLMTLVDDFRWAMNVSLTGAMTAKFAVAANDWGAGSYGLQPNREWTYGMPTWDRRYPNNYIPILMEGTNLAREKMVELGDWNNGEGLATGAGYATHLWLTSACDTVPPTCADNPDPDAWKCYAFREGEDMDWCAVTSRTECHMISLNDGSEDMASCDGCGCCSYPIREDTSGPSATCCVIFNDLYLNYTVSADLSDCAPVQKRSVDPPGNPFTTQAPFEETREDFMIFSTSTFWIIIAHCLPFPVCAILATWWLRRRKVIPVMEQLTVERVDGPNTFKKWEKLPQKVLVACLEHIIILPEIGVTVKVVAGGLGKVHGLLCQYHPGDFISVHPCMTDKDYSFCQEVDPVYVRIEGEEQRCEVYTYKRIPPADSTEPTVTFYMIDHPVFRDRHNGIYPAPQTARQTLIFYSIWNQALAKIIDRVQPDMFHCADFHSAVAPIYFKRTIPVFVILHNAEYQGTIMNMQMGKKEVHFFAEIFDLDVHEVKSDCMTDGGFNLLKPIVKYALEYQKGYGFCTVSRTYALEAMQKHQVLWPLPKLRGLENCMPENERPKLDDSIPFSETRRNAKLSVQKKFGLEQSVDARMFVFLGRWVKQKGMDYIADVADWMLSTYSQAQLLVIGPIGDAFGSYAAEKLSALSKTQKYDGRLFVYPGFLIVPKEMKLACDFCLMPSRDEPFGYVDIEFGWFGAPTVGAFKGGLGKVPGFYFQATNADSDAHVQRCLKRAISAAMEADCKVVEKMSINARNSSFPVKDWQDEMMDIYGELMFYHGRKRFGGGKKGWRSAVRAVCRRLDKRRKNKKKRGRRRRDTMDETAVRSTRDDDDEDSIPEEAQAQNTDRKSRTTRLRFGEDEEEEFIIDCDQPHDDDYGSSRRPTTPLRGRASGSSRLTSWRKMSTTSSMSEISVQAFPPTASAVAKMSLDERSIAARLPPTPTGSRGANFFHDFSPDHLEDCIFCRAAYAEIMGETIDLSAKYLWTSEASRPSHTLQSPSGSLHADSPVHHALSDPLGRGRTPSALSLNLSGQEKRSVFFNEVGTPTGSLLGTPTGASHAQRFSSMLMRGDRRAAYSLASVPSSEDSLGFPAHVLKSPSGPIRLVSDLDYRDLGFDVMASPSHRNRVSSQGLPVGGLLTTPTYQDIARIHSGLGFFSTGMGSAAEEAEVNIGEVELENYEMYGSTGVTPRGRRRGLTEEAAAVLQSYGYGSAGEPVTYASMRSARTRRGGTGVESGGLGTQSWNSDGLRESVASWSALSYGSDRSAGLSRDSGAEWDPAMPTPAHLTSLRELTLGGISEMASSGVSGFSPGDEEEEREVLDQELSEEVLQFLVEGKMTKFAGKYHSAPAVLEAVQWDLDLAKEKHRITHLLAVPMFDAILIDWIIAFAYASGPIVTSFFLSQCCSESFYVVEPLVSTFAVLAWTLLARECRHPNKLLMMVLFSRATCIIPGLIDGIPAWVGGVLLGISTAGDSLFIYFNFMGKQRGDISRLGGRTGFLVVLRKTCEWLYYAFVEVDGDMLIIARVISFLLCIVIPGLALFYAPEAYQRFSLPTLQKQFMMGLRVDGRCRVLLYLGLAVVVRNFSFVAERPGFLEWRMREDYPPSSIWIYGLYIGAANAVIVTMFAQLTDRFTDYTMKWIKAYAFFSLCPIFIRIWAMKNMAPYDKETAIYTDLVSFTSMVFESVQLLATTMAFVATVGSRWRLTVFTCVTTSLSGLAKACSTWIIQWYTGYSNPLDDIGSADELARACYYVAVIPCIFEAVLRVIGVFYFDQEATAMLWTRRQQQIAFKLDTDMKAFWKELKSLTLGDDEEGSEENPEEGEKKTSEIKEAALQEGRKEEEGQGSPKTDDAASSSAEQLLAQAESPRHEPEGEPPLPYGPAPFLARTPTGLEPVQEAPSQEPNVAEELTGESEVTEL